MRTYKVDDRSRSAMGIVEVGESIGQARSKMDEGESRGACHTAIAICCTCTYSFMKTQDGSDS